MVNYWNIHNTLSITTESLTSGYSLDYKTLMTAAGIYTPYTSDTYVFLTEAQKEANKLVEEIQTFNIDIYHTKWTNGYSETMNRSNYERATISDIRFSIYYPSSTSKRSDTLEAFKSYAIYGCSSVSVRMSWGVLTPEEKEEYMISKGEEYTEEDFNEEHKDKAGDSIYVYMTVEDPYTNMVPVCIHLVRAEHEESKEDEDKDDSGDNGGIVIPGLFDDVLEEDTYDVSITVDDKSVLNYIYINSVSASAISNTTAPIIRLTELEKDEEDTILPDDSYSFVKGDEKIAREKQAQKTEKTTAEQGSRLVVENNEGVMLSTVDDSETITFVSKTPLLIVNVNPLCPISFYLSVTVSSSTTGATKRYTYNYEPMTTNISGIGYKRAIKMNAPDVSYALLRTNPKLTGNIKVVVDSSSNIYLDTFRVSDVMSKKRYRHIKTGADTYYGKGISSQYKDIPSTELYKVQNSCYTMFTTSQTLKGQYYDTYQYGVRTNDDDMYSENFALLAPLCVKRIVPDFFLIFKVDKNKEEYNEIDFTDQNKIQYFLRYGKLIKSFDMRQGTELGNYVRKIYEMSKGYPGDVFESYDVNNANRFIGISLDRGVVAPIYESVYPQEETNNQVALNNFITGGFERNHIVSKDIINFEYMFNDEDDPMFSLNTYFGIYVKLNKQENDFSCIGYDNEKKEYLYDDTVLSFDKTVSLSQSSKYASLIYGVSTPVDFKRLEIGLPYSNVNEEFLLKPYKNILTTPVKTIKKGDVKSFITMSLTKPLDVGDHIRAISPDDQTIYEVILSDIDLLDDREGDYVDEYGLSECITNYYNEYVAGYTIKRVSMHVHSRDTIERDQEYFAEYYAENKSYPETYYTVDDVIHEEVKSLFQAFKRFGNEIVNSWKYEGNKISFVGYNNNIVFERICSASGFTESQYKYLRETNDEDDTLKFFGEHNGHKMILNMDTTSWKSYTKKYLYPMHFELVGSRMAYCVSFIPMESLGDTNNIYSIRIDDAKIFDRKSILYYTKESDSNVSKLLGNIYITFSVSNVYDVPYGIRKQVKYVQSYDDFDRYIINVAHPVLHNSSASLYSTYPINSGICSIFQMKDFDFDVLDGSRSILCNPSAEKIQGPNNIGEYTYDSVFNTTPPVGDISDEFITPSDTIAYMDMVNFKDQVDEMMRTAASQGSAKDFAGDIMDLEGFKSKVYILGPLLRGSYILDKSHNELGINMVFDHYDESEDSYVWIPKMEGGNPVVTQLITTGALSVDTFDTGYPKTPLRNNDEEDIRNYIDTHKHNDSSAYDSSWWGDISSESGQSYLSTLYNINHKLFDVSLVAPHCCKWVGIGSDARGENMRIMKDYGDALNGATSYYAAGPNTYNTYLGYLYTPDKVSSDLGTVKKYISKSLDNPYIIEESDSTGYSGHIYAKDYILEHLGTIDDLFYNELDNTNKFSVAYLSGQNTIEFISAGVKIRMRSMNDNALDFSKYDGYSAIFISLPAANKSYGKETELIIDEQRHELLFVWYQPVETLKLGYKLKEASTGIDKSFIMRLPYNKTYSDIKITYQVGGETTYLAMGLSDDYNYGEVEQEYGLDLTKHVVGEREPLKHKGMRLCKNKAYTFLSSKCYDKNSYTKPMSMGITGEIYDQKPVTETIGDTFPYYESKGKITALKPIVWGTHENNMISSSAVERAMIDVEEGIEGWLITDCIDYYTPSVGTYDDLKRAVKSCSIFIKSDNGKKDLTMVKNLLNISIIDPITYYKYPNTKNNIKGNNKEVLGEVHPTYAQPLMKDVFLFNYFSSRVSSSATLNYTTEGLGDVETIFKTSFDGANISIKDIAPISQTWFNKYTTDPNYCVQHVESDDNSTGRDLYRLSVDFRNNMNIMEDSWAHDTYRKYYIDNGVEKYTTIKGYESGYELKRYFNSKGIVLRGRDGHHIEITSWKNSEINTEENYIKLNISDSIVYNILFRESFESAWKYINPKNNDTKINYIKNTVMKFININNKTKFVLRRSKNQTRFISFLTDYNDDFTTEEVINYRNELKYENGKYYMYVYPEDKHVYYAKMIITL